MSPIKEGPPLFLTKHYSFNLKKNKLQSIHYGNVSTDLLETVRGYLRIRAAQLGTAGLEEANMSE